MYAYLTAITCPFLEVLLWLEGLWRLNWYYISSVRRLCSTKTRESINRLPHSANLVFMWSLSYGLQHNLYVTILYW